MLRITATALVIVLGFAGAASAQNAMSAPMAPDAMATPMAPGAMAPMAPDAMAPMAGDPMAPMLEACLSASAMITDMMQKDGATAACHAAHNMAMAAPMAGDAMAPMAPAAAPAM
jgi:hypothetical protein